MVKSPKIYIRDSGICHALLGIESLNALMGHPVVGGSWEGFIVEAIFAHKSPSTQAGFYRTSAGAEVDLVLSTSAGELWAIEIKLTSAPKVTKGFHLACEDLKPARKIIIHGGDDNYPFGGGIEARSVKSIQDLFKQTDRN